MTPHTHTTPIHPHGVNNNAEQLRHDSGVLLDALAVAGADVHRPKAIRCPFHEDNTPSAGIYVDDAGVWRFKCQSQSCGVGGDVYDIRARNNGTQSRDEFKREIAMSPQLMQSREATPQSKPAKRFASIEAARVAFGDVEATYVYADPVSGHAELIVFRRRRYDGRKFFTQARPDGEGEGDGGGSGGDIGTVGIVLGAPPKP